MILKGCAASFRPQLGSVSKNMGFHFWPFLKSLAVFAWSTVLVTANPRPDNAHDARGQMIWVPLKESGEKRARNSIKQGLLKTGERSCGASFTNYNNNYE